MKKPDISKDDLNTLKKRFNSLWLYAESVQNQKAALEQRCVELQRKVYLADEEEINNLKYLIQDLTNMLEPIRPEEDRTEKPL